MNESLSTATAATDESQSTVVSTISGANESSGHEGNGPNQTPAAIDGSTIAFKPGIASKHGLYALHPVLPDESREEFESLNQDLREQYNPIGALEEHLVAEVADAIWIGRRLSRQYTEACRNNASAKQLPRELGNVVFKDYWTQMEFINLAENLRKLTGLTSATRPPRSPRISTVPVSTVSSIW